MEVGRAGLCGGSPPSIKLAYRAAGRIAMRIVSLTPTTVQESAFKFRVLLDRFGDGCGGIDDSVPIVRFAADLDTLAATIARTA